MGQSAESNQRATSAYIAPFAVYVGIMALERFIAIPLLWLLVVRFLVVLAILWFVSRPYFSLRPCYPLASIGIGIAVFVAWVGPDLLFGSGYRHSWLFQNSVTGTAASSLTPELKRDVPFLVVRSLSSMALVPVLEELFWRGWLMRWLIDKDFLHVPLGKYAPSAFWIVAAAFASEHGPYWEVGLAAGIIYNWWLIHTKTLGDCILAHAVTNGILAAYVIGAGQWQYWL